MQKRKEQEEVAIVLPNQLFENNPCLENINHVYLIEEYLFFSQYKFHKSKLAYHRATMKFYESYLSKKGYTIHYVSFDQKISDIRELMSYLIKQKVKVVHICIPVDNWIEKRIGNSKAIETKYYPTPMFINSTEEIKEYFKDKKRLYQTDFYIAQRKKRNILLDKAGNPEGGKWTFDTENRLKYPKEKIPPKVKTLKLNEFDKEAHAYIEKHFDKNYGTLGVKYASTFEEAKTMLNDFLEHRFLEFGEYEDAIVEKENILHHSVLTPMLNCGLLTPLYVIDESIAYAKKHKIPINSLEGFVRQILGWREFIRAVYILKGVEERTRNFWSFKRKLPKSFYNGTTKIAPLDDVIKKVLKTAYNHHIERLMILGNLMLLMEIRPNDVYKWFMEMYIDAYDWVMVPNVYGMSQFADGGLMATKPYISGSNYIMKMSDYKKGEWQSIWDALFWCFMDKHRAFFLKNPRLGMLIKTYDKMPDEKKKSQYELLEKYFKEIK